MSEEKHLRTVDGGCGPAFDVTDFPEPLRKITPKKLLAIKGANPSRLGNRCFLCKRSHTKDGQLWLVPRPLLWILDSLFHGHQQRRPCCATVHGYAVVRLTEGQKICEDGYQEGLLSLADYICRLGCDVYEYLGATDHLGHHRQHRQLYDGPLSGRHHSPE